MSAVLQVWSRGVPQVLQSAKKLSSVSLASFSSGLIYLGRTSPFNRVFLLKASGAQQPLQLPPSAKGEHPLSIALLSQPYAF